MLKRHFRTHSVQIPPSICAGSTLVCRLLISSPLRTPSSLPLLAQARLRRGLIRLMHMFELQLATAPGFILASSNQGLTRCPALTDASPDPIPSLARPTTKGSTSAPTLSQTWYHTQRTPSKLPCVQPITWVRQRCALHRNPATLAAIANRLVLVNGLHSANSNP